VEISHDVLVIGAGCAGMRAAIEAHDAGADVALVSKLHPTRSHSGAARGGINAALGNAGEDSPEQHAADTVKGSDYLGDQDAIELFCNEAPGDIYELESPATYCCRSSTSSCSHATSRFTRSTSSGGSCSATGVARECWPGIFPVAA
jgi:succinate dehydrogenase/fumarate reductase flavoprotein subunit